MDKEPRFTVRIEFLEEPPVADQLERRAIRDGGTVASVIRRAIRRELEGSKR